VFTLPPPIAAIGFQNRAAVYAMLFKSAVEAMTTLAANPRRLGAKIGGLAILHTWGPAPTHHPHVHSVVPGGGLSLDGARWIEGRANFFLAVKPLSRLFRHLFLERLRAAFDRDDLGFFGDLAHLAAARRVDWIVYAKKPFGGPAQVLAYLGRYTAASRMHRPAIPKMRVDAASGRSIEHHNPYRRRSSTVPRKLASRNTPAASRRRPPEANNTHSAAVLPAPSFNPASMRSASA
jgi:Putative transposase